MTEYIEAYGGLGIITDDTQMSLITVEALQQALDASALMEPSPEGVEALGEGWIAEEALAIAVYAALVHENDIKAALLLAVNHGGDSDSTGAITGNLLGAARGLVGTPNEWVTANEVTALVAAATEALV